MCTRAPECVRGLTLFAGALILLHGIGVRQLTWPMISVSTSRPAQAFAVPKKRTVAPIAPSMATATNAKILAVFRTPSVKVVYAWTWWPMSSSPARVPNTTLIAWRVVREELPRKVRSCSRGIRFANNLQPHPMCCEANNRPPSIPACTATTYPSTRL